VGVDLADDESPKFESMGESGMDDGGSGNLEIWPRLIVLSAMADALVSIEPPDLCRLPKPGRLLEDAILDRSEECRGGKYQAGVQLKV
jgi:hypothetical protein